MTKFALTTGVVLLLATRANAAGDTNSYSLFHATPSDKLRPLSSETYDATVDARTVDAGHVQVESALIDYSYFTSEGTVPQNPNFETHYWARQDSYQWAPKITVGLLDNLDFFVRPTYQVTRLRESVTRSFPLFPLPPFYVDQRSSDFGPIDAGVKVNLWGNDGGRTALAVQPFVAIPRDGGDWMGGMDLAGLVRAPYGFWVKIDSGVYTLENQVYTFANFQIVPQRDLFVGFDNSISINKQLCSWAEMYWYFNSTVTTEYTAPWHAMTGFGWQLDLPWHLQFFAGMGFGLRDVDNAYNPRAGFVWRF